MCQGTPITVLVVSSLLFAHPALAWGVKTHTWITENAVRLLPDGELRASLERELRAVTANSMAPDFQLKDGLVRTLEYPDHFVNLERFGGPQQPSDLPRTRVEAARLYTALGLSYDKCGFLPWRIEETYLGLVNAMKTDRSKTAFYAGLLSHYVADAHVPLHTTIHYDGRITETGPRFLEGLHGDYEITFIEDRNIEFRESSFAEAAAPAALADVFEATVHCLYDAFALVDSLYMAAEAHQGPDKYALWDREIGPLTRRQLGRAASLVASMWLTAWTEASQ